MYAFALTQTFIWICTFVVKSLGCWMSGFGNEVIPDNHGALGIHGCYKQAKSLGNTVFGVYKGEDCYTTSTAGNTYKKYGPAIFPKKCSLDVYEIANGNSLYLYNYINTFLH